MALLTLILLLIFGSGVAFLAVQNSIPVNLTLFTLTFPGVPLSLVILGSLLAGLLLAYILYLAKSISSALKIHSKDKIIRDSEKDLTQLTKKIHQLELENESLKKDNPNTSSDDKSL